MSDRDDGLSRADISTSALDDPKMRRLAQRLPDDGEYAAAVVVWMTTLLASWREGRRLSAGEAESWVAATPERLAALREVRLLDDEGRIPAHAWERHYGPAHQRVHRLRTLNPSGKSKDAREGSQEGTPTGTPEGSREGTHEGTHEGPVSHPHQASRPSSPPSSQPTDQPARGSVDHSTNGRGPMPPPGWWEVRTAYPRRSGYGRWLPVPKPVLARLEAVVADHGAERVLDWVREAAKLSGDDPDETIDLVEAKAREASS